VGSSQSLVVEVDLEMGVGLELCQSCADIAEGREGAERSAGRVVGGPVCDRNQRTKTTARPVEFCIWYLEGRGSQALTVDIDDDIDRG